MKCELCHNADAETAIVRGEGDDAEELYVCKACAKAERLRRQKKSQRTRKVTGLPPGMSMSITQIGSDGESEDGETPPPFIGGVFFTSPRLTEKASRGILIEKLKRMI